MLILPDVLIQIAQQKKKDFSFHNKNNFFFCFIVIEKEGLFKMYNLYSKVYPKNGLKIKIIFNDIIGEQQKCLCVRFVCLFFFFFFLF